MRAALAVFLVFGALGVGSVRAEEEILLTITHDGEAVVGSEVTVFLSDGMLADVTDDAGNVTFEAKSGRGFWVEVDGARLDRFFFVDQAPYEIDLAVVDTIDWPGR